MIFDDSATMIDCAFVFPDFVFPGAQPQNVGANVQNVTASIGTQQAANARVYSNQTQNSN